MAIKHLNNMSLTTETCTIISIRIFCVRGLQQQFDDLCSVQPQGMHQKGTGTNLYDLETISVDFNSSIGIDAGSQQGFYLFGVSPRDRIKQSLFIITLRAWGPAVPDEQLLCSDEIEPSKRSSRSLVARA